MASNKLADLNLDIKLNIEDNGRIKQLDKEFTDFVSKTGNPITLLFAVLCILGLICKRKH